MMGKADELDNLFGREEAELRRRERSAMVERNEERSAAEAKAEAMRQQKARDFLGETNARMRLAEYQRAGVEPPPGSISLSLLLSLGWTIEEVEGKRVLVKPPHVEPPPRRERQQS